ncbi:MAG: GNAT family N-acetyltransferase, partial [Microbacteriaceae bacterium]|nr:GNAT family N-acetyltransferase [Microbacteriaceae bacterium]
MSQFTVELLQSRQVPSAVSLIQESFPARLLKFMIYGQTGIIDFLRAGIEHGDELRKSEFLVVPGAGNEVVACAEFTFPEEGMAHLAYLAVDPGQRGRGIATQLIREFILHHAEVHSVDLEVFSDNKPARKLYAGMGFVTEAGSTWRSRELPEPRGHLDVRDPGDSLTTHTKFGFSQFQVECEKGWITLGRLGEDVVRTYAAEIFDDVTLLAAVRELFPSMTTAFIIDGASNAARVSGPHTVLAESTKMRLQ